MVKRMVKRIPEIAPGGAKHGFTAAFPVEGVEILFTAPDVEALRRFVATLGGKLEEEKTKETLIIPMDSVRALLSTVDKTGRTH